MKLSTFRLMLKEGIINIYKNKLMSLASMTMVIASLIILGLFLLFALNLIVNIEEIKKQPEVTIYCDHELDEEGILNIERAIKEDERVREYTVKTKQEAFEFMKDILEENKDVLEGYSEEIMMVSFEVSLYNPENSPAFVETMESIEGIWRIKYSQEVVEFITRLVYWVNLISIFIVAILLVISVFIISNTIKLTVFARRKEVGIMKYVGATDWFIRWPFIIEGIVIGILGSIISYILTSYGYNVLESAVNSGEFKSSLIFTGMVKLDIIGSQLFIIYAIIGTIMGAVGSIVSLRKHLKV